MWYVYVIKSEEKNWKYVDHSSNLKERINQHNAGKTSATRNYRPFKLVSYIDVNSEEKAINLEKYLKSGSGIAWMNKRLVD